MKRAIDFLGAFLTALALCMLPARADVLPGPAIGIALVVLVLAVAVVAVAASLLFRAVRRLRKKRLEEENPDDRDP